MSEARVGTRAVAPGKAFVCGEYAVLEGGMAVVAAVDRLAVAEIRSAADAPPATDFVAAALAEMKTRFGLTVPGIAIDTSAFSHRENRKLGLGSSAATVAATVCAVWLAHERPLARARMTLHDAALAAHARAQEARGAAGSGADVSASIMGGLTGFQRTASITRAVHLDHGPLSGGPGSATLCFVDTGNPADTAGMLANLGSLRDRARTRYDSTFEALRQGARRFLSALEAAQIHEMIQEYDSYGAALEALGVLAGSPIVTPAHAAVRTLARALGGAAKPSGAGGGDLAAVLLPPGIAPEALDPGLAAAGLARVPLALRHAGAGLEQAR
ncbi:MAG: hypothetical protein IT370_02495 [Deltaproteobacteria bacterium]|nr:hypothetical protein [Deltaproteobacteria bacterium]